MKTYVTVQGDMFDRIAHEQLGSDRYVDVLMKSNSDYIDVYVFSAGVELLIPDIDDLIPEDSIPPWKQVSG